MSPQEFRETHGAPESWSAEDYEDYLDICDEARLAASRESGLADAEPEVRA